MKINPKCLYEFQPAAYTSDGYMLPCCWMDDPPVYRYIKECGLKDEELLLSNNDRLDDIFTSDQWENFFSTLLNDPDNASYMCKKKCGLNINLDEIQSEAKEELRIMNEKD
tara:strand:- start:122 stop:454 length:333 start_codon:yes stop_codon:yes gene_type:complete